ncbi:MULTISPECIES: TatD family hydrolase [Luteimonas]|uniref:TatD family hydrolase n=1 Tax=Luteimonas TaxID=83614 RepID=UPI000C7ACC91|nr:MULTISPECIES: TatD family hydrolase [Luteimonas]
MLVDSHCHLDVDEFAADRAEVLARARAAGVTHQVVPAIRARDWTTLRAVCASAPGLHAAYGLHPVFLDDHTPGDLQTLREWLAREAPVAVGECGLDYYVDGLDRDRQTHYFDAQLALARDFDLPVIVHARRAVDAVISAIRRYPGVRGVVHSFPGSEQQAAQLHALGFLVGIGGPVTYARAQRLRRTVTALPDDQLLLETDAPDQPDDAIRGQRNEPARLRRILEVVAELRGVSTGSLAATTSRNAARLFGWADAT